MRSFARGTSLIELLIASSIMLVIMACITAVLLAGFSYVRSNEKALDTQRNVLLMLTKLSQDIEQSDYSKGIEYGKDEGLQGVTFISPFSNQNNPGLNLSNGFQTDQTSGAMEFQSYICYYLDNTTTRLYRNEVPYTAYPPAAGTTQPPTLLSANLCPVAPPTAPLLVAWWIGSPPSPPIQVADNIQSFLINSTAVGSGSAVVNITVSAGDANHGPNDKESYWFNIITLVSPRN